MPPLPNPHLETGPEIRTIQTLLGHSDVRTTMVYTPIVDRGLLGIVNPLDRWDAKAPANALR